MRRAILLVALASGCGSDDDMAPGADGGGAGGWESVEVLFEDPGILVERVSYRSGGLLIYGQVCRPREGGPFPVVVANHGGFSGLGLAADSGNCVDLARMGYLWIGSSYRGEDGSEGEVEVCLGEVDDVLAMIDVALAQSYADPDRVVMWGASHGGCITTRALQRGAPVHAAVDVFGPTDWATNYEFWVAEYDSNPALYQELIGVLDQAVGGGPDELPEQYRARSPLHFELPDGIPFLVTHGAIDALVPPSQSCALAAAAGLESYHLDGAQMEVTSPPAGCEEDEVTWNPGPRPAPDWSGQRYLVVYDQLGHDFAGNPGAAMLGDIVSFMDARLPP